MLERDDEITLEVVASEQSRIAAAASAAREQGIAVGRLIGRGSYALVFAATAADGRSCALKLPFISDYPVDQHPDLVDQGHGPNRLDNESATGPFVLRRLVRLDDAATLIANAARQQRERGAGHPLPELFASVDLAGLPAVLMERVAGLSLRAKIDFDHRTIAKDLRGLTESVVRLHREFGPHGDLKPEHVIFSHDGGVYLIDPLGDDGEWLGSIGYALPTRWDILNPATRTNALRARDVAALAAMIAELHGGSFNWSGSITYAFANRHNGRFGGMELGGFAQALYEGTEPVPEPWRSWVRKTGGDYLGMIYEICAEDATWPDRVLAELQDMLV